MLHSNSLSCKNDSVDWLSSRVQLLGELGPSFLFSQSVPEWDKISREIYFSVYSNLRDFSSDRKIEFLDSEARPSGRPTPSRIATVRRNAPNQISKR